MTAGSGIKSRKSSTEEGTELRVEGSHWKYPGETRGEGGHSQQAALLCEAASAELREVQMV